jgi:hypothetical protein
MTRTPNTYDEAARLFLSGELDSTKQIASAVKVTPGPTSAGVGKVTGTASRARSR